jgi:hypothetical protein
LNEDRSCRFGSPVRCDILTEENVGIGEIINTD